MQNQKFQTLNFLRNSNTGITSWDAISTFRITRLAARISELKDDGHTIETIMEQDNGTGKRYARYYLIKEASL
jgi:hypothetical protein